MGDKTVLLSISEMIDLAIGTPEIGVVDFCMLHTVLHCLAQQLGVSGKNVELKGSVGALPFGQDRHDTLAVTEYVIQTDDKDEANAGDESNQTTVSGDLGVPKTETDKRTLVESDGKSTKNAEPDQDTVLVVERVKKVDSPLERLKNADTTRAAETKKTSSPTRKERKTEQEASPAATQQITSPVGRITSTEKLSLVTLSKFNILEDAVKDLKDKVYGSMPKNEDILEEVRSQTNMKAISDVWTSLNVSSRLEAAEEGIGKLSSLIQDLIAETPALKENFDRRASKALKEMPGVGGGSQSGSARPLPTEGADKPGEIEQKEGSSSRPGNIDGPPTRGELEAIKTQLERLRNNLAKIAKSVYAETADLPEDFSNEPSIMGQSIEPSTVSEVQQSEIADGTQELQKTTQASASDSTRSSVAGETMRPEGHKSMLSLTSLMERLDELEKRLKECCDTIGKNDGVIQEQINSLQDQVEYLSKQLANISDSCCITNQSAELPKDIEGLMTLFQTVQDMQEQLKQVHDTALHLAAEKEDRQKHMNALIEQIELLKTIKLDREDMEEAMAEKADLRLLARKVSHDKFEVACDDLSRGLEQTLGKLDMQEALWQQALDDIQREIEMKLDKMELSPVKDFFNNKLRQLQENLKKIASLRRQTEAAGTKRRLLQDVNCISCDANAVMAMDTGSTVPVLRPLAPNLSMKPYLSYELDAIRKAQATSVPQRNMHDWENIEKQRPQKQQQRPRSENDKHLCNRYCGGSHTVTTPAQRVARLGHFIKQWGPDVVPLSSGLAAGDDGRLYKVSTAEGAGITQEPGATEAVCTPKPPKKSESEKTHKIVITSQECRCLEDDKPRKL